MSDSKASSGGVWGHLKMLVMRRSTVSFTGLLRLGWGKTRRLCLYVFRRGYVEKAHKVREGECGRCGACCKLLYECPHLEEDGNGMTRCIIHDHRPPNCRIFPVDLRDLRDRDLVKPDLPCRYTFRTAGEREEEKK